MVMVVMMVFRRMVLVHDDVDDDVDGDDEDDDH